jgi:TIGR03009 family protein
VSAQSSRVADGGSPVRAGEAVVGLPMAPTWLPLSPSHQEYVNQVLDYWEHKNSRIQRYRCTFKRFEYDPVFGPKDTFNTYSEGSIKYAAPDKGLFRVEKMLHYQPPREPGSQPAYVALEDDPGDHWVCDGQWIYQFDHARKTLVQTELPPEFRGKAIGKGPLPFLFNARAEDIRQRFWIRVITPAEAKGEYWLEAVPKMQEDVANFKMIHVILDEADFLPKAMILFDRNFVPVERPSRTTFQFNDREVNFSILAEQLNLFHREFYEPRLPPGWNRQVDRQPAPGTPGPETLPGPRGAQDSAPARR